MSPLPSGTVTFLFTDVEGSTELLLRLGDGYASELEAHRAVVSAAVATAGGEIVDQRGEEAFAAFPRAADGVAAAIEIQRRHADRVMRVRIGLHTGEPALAGDRYLGLDVHRAARICAAGHGGQVLLSQTTRGLISGVGARDLGDYALHGISVPERIYALDVPYLGRSFPALRAPPAKPPRRLGRTPSAEPQKRGLQELAWSVRATLPGTRESDRPAVVTLAATLLTASKVEASASAFLARVDRRILERNLASYQRMGVNSHRSRQEAEKVERSLVCVDAVAAARETLVHSGQRERPVTEEIAEATARLEQMLAEARAAVGDSAERLRRTRSRAVYRSGSGEFVVLAYDTLGIERRHRFDTRTEARAFHLSVRLTEKQQQEYTGPSMKNMETTGGGGPS